MHLVVGLGNPGRQYAATPHNAGFMVVEELARRLGETLRESARLQASVVKADLEGKRTVLAQPLTFMNNSGAAVNAILRCNGIDPSDMIVVLDDADLEPGALRIRKKGGSGGHKGLQSILATVGTDAFVRVRIGIGRDPHRQDLVSHVLKPLSGEAREALVRAVARAADAVACILQEGADAAMNKFNATETERGAGESRDA